MADTKITALTAISTVDPAVDVLPIVDVSDTTMAASGTTKKITSNQLLGAGGTATLASATITGDLTVDTSTLKVDSANNRVGINKASPTVPLDVVGASIFTVADAAYATALNATTGNLRLYPYYDANYGSALLAFNAGYAGYGPLTLDASRLSFYISGSTAMTLNSTGLGVGVAPSAGKGCLQLSSGINFPATQVASSDANTLDDYEEGVWSGTLKGGTTDPTTPVTVNGIYTKIGRVVNISIAFESVDTSGASGSISITGLPFAVGGARQQGVAASLLAATFTGYMIATATVSGTTLELFSVNSAAGWTAATHNAGTGRFLWVNMVYIV